VGHFALDPRVARLRNPGLNDRTPMAFCVKALRSPQPLDEPKNEPWRGYTMRQGVAGEPHTRPKRLRCVSFTRLALSSHPGDDQVSRNAPIHASTCMALGMLIGPVECAGACPRLVNLNCFPRPALINLPSPYASSTFTMAHSERSVLRRCVLFLAFG
jgi:hypothetical protein